MTTNSCEDKTIGSAPRKLSIGLLHQQIELNGENSPHHIAIEDGERTITYGEFVQLGRRLASSLKAMSLPRNSRIGIFIENSIEAYVAIFGVLRADCCYVPLGATLPVQRLSDVLQDSGCKVIITVSSLVVRLMAVAETLDGVALIVLNADPPDPNFPPSEDMERAFTVVLSKSDVMSASRYPGPNDNIAEDLAYIIYTSGTTGRPKGVGISHGSLRDFINWAVDYLQIGPSDKVSNHPSIHFDLSIVDVFGALAAGATLCPVNKPGDKFLPGSFIRRHKITVWVSVPSVLAAMQKAKQLKPNLYAETLRAAVFCGEILPPDLTHALQAASPSMDIYNLYGPTEATCACTYYKVDCSKLRADRPVPIGVANANTELFVLRDSSDGLASVNEVGRLMVGGSQLAYGYWGRPDLTAEVFRQNPLKRDLPVKMYDTGDLAYQDEQGIFHYVGRRDFQVKIQGHRVELSEIEMVIRQHRAVVDVGICVLHGAFVDIAVGIVIDPQANGQCIVDEVRSECSARLPTYMVPKFVYVVDELPKTSNGKSDRKKLNEMITQIKERCK